MNCLAISDTGEQLAAGSHKIKIWDIETKTVLVTVDPGEKHDDDRSLN
jgi:WD40 repeat protein